MVDVQPIVEVIREFVVAHPYVLLSIGFFFAHESVFIPSIYLGLNGKLDLQTLVVLMIVMSVISDAVVHLIGRYISEERIRRHVSPKIARGLDMGHEFFGRHGLMAIFISRFIYGTRVATQLFSGMFRVPFLSYLAMNTLGMTAFIVTLTVVLASAQTSFSVFMESVTIVKILILGVVLVGIFWWARSRRKKV